jgi:hypothetical protein
MLELTLKTAYVPGTNLANGLAGAPWRFLLPSLRPGHILCLGIPPAATLKILALMSDDVTVASTEVQQLEKIRQVTEPPALDKVRLLPIDNFAHLPVPSQSVALVLLGGEPKQRASSVLSELGRILKNDGVIYLETQSWLGNLASRKALQKLASLGFGASKRFRLLQGTAFPLADEQMADFLFSNILHGQSFKKRLLSRAGKLLNHAGLLHHIAPHQAVIVQRSGANHDIPPAPDYLRDLAARAGADLSGWRCGLSMRGKYNANKTIFYLFERGETNAKLVAKMTRAPEFNYRLENEYRALSLLRAQDFIEAEAFPQPAFFGYHAGLAVLGQKAVHGEPFRQRTQATVDCLIAQRAVNLIVQLGVASADNGAATAAQAGNAMMQLFERFAALYHPSPFERDFLTAQIETIRSTRGHFPLVFQHGDPGTWNLLVSAPGQVIMIDWEAGEPQGMPLWDLFYFMRSYGSWMARRQGIRDSLRSFAQQFLEPSGLGAHLAETVAQYSSLIGLPEHLIAPLFYTCWMHRALKEAARLTPASLSSGHYVNLLRLCIARRNAAGLISLFALCKSSPRRAPANKDFRIQHTESVSA